MNTPQHSLYRFYSDTGQLLYVGRTINPGQRFTDHARTKTWWPEVRGITVQDYPDADTLAAAERRAIDVEQPAYNLQRPKLRPTAQASPTRDLVWICEHCTQPVDDGTGYLHINLTEVHQAEVAEAKLGEYVDIDQLLEIRTPRWQTHHQACDPDLDAPDYFIDVNRLRTHADLLARTAHLSGKRWIDITDWYDLIARLAEVRP